MDKPKLVLGGKEHSPLRPTRKVWRAIAEHDSADTENMTIKEILINRLDILSLVYGVEVDEIEESIDVADILPTYNAAAKWVLSLVFEKLDNIPNGAAGTGET